MKESEQIRVERTRKFYGITSLVLLVIIAYLLWALKTILIPVIIGLLSAYICLPIFKYLKGVGVSKAASVFILFSGFFLLIILVFQLVSMAIPNEEGRTELKASLMFNIQEKYQSIMSLKPEGSDGNLMYRLTGNELDPIVHQIICTLKLDEEEKELWDEIVKNDRTNSRLKEGYLTVSNKLNCKDKVNNDIVTDVNNGNLIPLSDAQPPVLTSIFQFLSIWFIMPFVFVYALIDNGKTRKKLIYLIPNAYFEATLTTLHSVDKAIGTYLRCLISNMLIIGGLFSILLRIVGFETIPALIIGVLNGVLNAIPVIGSLVGLITILLYAIIIEHPATILPFIDRDSIILWAFIIYCFVQIIDNVVLKPFLMGKAIDLNPLVIIFAAVGGTIIGGGIGILLAIPVVLVANVGFYTLKTELKRYFLIY